MWLTYAYASMPGKHNQQPKQIPLKELALVWLNMTVGVAHTPTLCINCAMALVPSFAMNFVLFL